MAVCRWENSGALAVETVEGTAVWMMGPAFLTNVTIRNNTFVHAGGAGAIRIAGATANISAYNNTVIP